MQRKLIFVYRREENWVIIIKVSVRCLRLLSGCFYPKVASDISTNEVFSLHCEE